MAQTIFYFESIRKMAQIHNETDILVLAKFFRATPAHAREYHISNVIIYLFKNLSSISTGKLPF